MITSLADHRTSSVRSVVPPLSAFLAYLEALLPATVIGTTHSETANPFAVWLTGSGTLVRVNYVEVFLPRHSVSTPLYMVAVLSRLEGLRHQAQLVTAGHALAVTHKVTQILENYDARRTDS